MSLRLAAAIILASCLWAVPSRAQDALEELGDAAADCWVAMDATRYSAGPTMTGLMGELATTG